MTAARNERRRSISARLLTFSTLFVTIAILVASVILWLIVAGVVREQIDQRLETQIEALRGALATRPGGPLVLDTSLAAALNGPPFDRIGGGWYWQVSGSGQPLTSVSLAGRTLDDPPRPQPRHHGPPSLQKGDTDDRQGSHATDRGGGKPDGAGPALYRRSLDLVLDGGAVASPVTITATAPLAALNDPARRALVLLVPAMLVLGLSLIAGTFLQVRYGLRPLKTLTQTIAEVAAGTRETLPDADTQELKPVSREINRLIQANVARLAETRLHFANLAHGLKTPVASLSLALTEDNDPEGDKRRLVERIEERIRHHLARARKTTSAAGLGASTVIAPHIADIAGLLSRIHADRALTVALDVPADLAVGCASEDVDEMLGNVVDNAFKWAARSVSIRAAADGRQVAITIEDDGPGLSREDAERVFLPGIRMDEQVQGDGFGLTIARELCALYGGGITLDRSPSGGLSVRVLLPRGERSAHPA